MSAHDCPHCDCESDEDIQRFWKSYAEVKAKFERQEKLSLGEMWMLQAGQGKIAELTRPNPLFGEGSGKKVRWTF